MRRVVTLIAAMAVALGLMAAPAVASHVHGRNIGDGSCVVLAASGGEQDVVLPEHLTEGFGEGRQHPLHVLVHFGAAGDDIFVHSSEDCVNVRS